MWKLRAGFLVERDPSLFFFHCNLMQKEEEKNHNIVKFCYLFLALAKNVNEFSSAGSKCILYYLWLQLSNVCSLLPCRWQGCRQEGRSTPLMKTWCSWGPSVRWRWWSTSLSAYAVLSGCWLPPKTKSESLFKAVTRYTHNTYIVYICSGSST